MRSFLCMPVLAPTGTADATFDDPAARILGVVHLVSKQNKAIFETFDERTLQKVLTAGSY